MIIKPSKDTKVQFRPHQKNSFGMLPGAPEHGGTCPQATYGKGGCCYIPEGKKCAVCYVDKLMRARPNIGGVLKHNTKLTELDYDSIVDILKSEFQRFDDEEARAEARGAKAFRYYRLHWSGDIPNEKYARALATAVLAFPDITFWVYTRSFDFISIIDNIDNLRVHMSLDGVNMQAGLDAWSSLDARDTGTQVKLAYMGKLDNRMSALKINDTKHKRYGEDRLAYRYEPVLVSCAADVGEVAQQYACSNCMRCFSRGLQFLWFIER